jgi:hypothetical protein
MMSSAQISAMLKGYRFHWATETELQDGIQRVLEQHEVDHIREHPLGDAGRVDFFIAGLAMEVKLRVPQSAVLRQLHRYAAHEDVSSILLVTCSMRHSVPPTLNGKPVSICRLTTL